jgi:hypothetical protein
MINWNATWHEERRKAQELMTDADWETLAVWEKYFEWVMEQ